MKIFANNIKLILLTVVCLVSLTSAQERPKIGLALSGGGAKGFAHIGVIKALEDAGIPIDYISGTSMGAVVGALYAIGYSTDDLEKIATTLDWDNLFTDNVQREDLGMVLKQWDGRYAITLAIQDRAVQLPSGIIGGQRIFQLLDRLTLPVQDITDFRQFPIPFSCVAVDIVTGQPVVLNRGKLTQAVRASMSIPSVFTPVKIGDQLLVDGGLVRNLPAQDVLDLGADIVIGVDVGAPLYREEELKSFLNIVDQMTSLQKAAVNAVQTKLCDYLIVPDLSEHGAANFSKADYFMKQGRIAADSVLAAAFLPGDSTSLMDFSVDSIPPPILPDSLYITEIEIDGLFRVSQRIVNTELKMTPPGYIQMPELEDAIDRIYSTQLFSRVTYTVNRNDDGNKLTVQVLERSRNLFRIGLRYDSTNDAAMLLNATLQNIGKFGSILAFDLKLGLDPMFDAEYFLRTTTKSHIGVRTGFNYMRSSLDLFSGKDRVAQFRLISYIGDLLFGKIFSKKWALGVGVRGEYVDGNPSIAPADTPDREEILATLYGAWRIDTLNRTVFPSSGIFMNSEIALADDRMISNRTFHRAFVDFRAYIPVSEKWTVLFNTFLGATSTESDVPLHYFFMLGGMDTPFTFLGNRQSFLALRTQERVGGNAQFLQLGAQLNLPGRRYLLLRWNAGEIFDTFEIDFTKNSYITGIGLTAGLDTRLGPVDFTVMGGSQHNVLGYLNLGYTF